MAGAVPELQQQLVAQRAFSRDDDSVADSGKCPCCALPIKPRKKYCEEHNRAFERLGRRAKKPPLGQKDKVRKKMLKKKPRREKTAKARFLAIRGGGDFSSSSPIPMTDEHIAFIEISGEGRNPGHFVIANRANCDFVAMYPGGKEPRELGKGGPNNFTLTSFTSKRGAQHAKKNTAKRMSMDWEAFVAAMENSRKIH